MLVEGSHFFDEQVGTVEYNVCTSISKKKLLEIFKTTIQGIRTTLLLLD